MTGRILPTSRLTTVETFKALASSTRLKILGILSESPCSIKEISSKLNIAQPTATVYVQQLEKIGLIKTHQEPAVRGSQKICQLIHDGVSLKFAEFNEKRKENLVEVSMPIGNYVEFGVFPPCCLADEHKILRFKDDPTTFLEPEHVNAQFLSFGRGFVRYLFPRRVPANKIIEQLKLSMEISSEASQPAGENECPSDITLWINGVEIGTWTSPGFYTLQRGRYTPDWWYPVYNQFGMLKEWTVSPEGSYIDGVRLSGIKIEDLHLTKRRFITVQVGHKDGAKNVGGVTLFGRKFGNHPQDIILRLDWKEQK